MQGFETGIGMNGIERGMAAPAPVAPTDVKHVSLRRDQEVRYWSNRLNASRAELEEAVDHVGHHVNAVVDYLHRNG